MSKRLSKLMLIANFVSVLFYSMSYPYIYAQTCKIVPTHYISIEQLLSCIGTIVFCWLWNKYSDRLFNHYAKIIVAETLLDVILFADVMIRNDLKFFFLLNVMIYALVTRNMACGGTKMRAMVNPTERDREQYDNNSNIVVSVATILGTVAAFIYMPDFKVLCTLALIGNVSDNVLYGHIYREIKKDDKNEGGNIFDNPELPKEI